MRILCLLLKKLFRIPHKINGRLRSVYYSNIFAACGKKKHPRIAKGVVFSYPENISCGNGLIINPQVYFAAKGGIELGDNVTISAGAKILSSSLQVENGQVSRRHIHKKTVLGNNVWLGAGAVICPGVTIGDNTIVAAGAVVTKDIEGNCIYAGIPAKKIKELIPVQTDC